MEPDIFQSDIFGEPVIPELGSGTLAARFLIPPFSVLNAREGPWQARKRAWLALGIASELGRGGNLLELSEEAELYRRGEGDYAKDAVKRAKDAAPGGGGGPRSGYFAAGQPPRPGSLQDRTRRREGNDLAAPGGTARPNLDQPNRDARRAFDKKNTASLKGGLTYGLTMTPYAPNKPDYERKKRINDPKHQTGLIHKTPISMYAKEGEEASAADCGTSIFDPVLCELMYRWFSPVGGQVIDPFAGGSVRGITAAMLGRKYWGSDLSADQIRANEVQGRDIVPPNKPAPVWVCGDSSVTLLDAPEADMIMSCPPYFDLEVYSKDPRDLSTMKWEDFRSAYWDIIAAAAGRLRDNRFAVFVTGDMRDERGCYRNFHGDTVRAFKRAGLEYYNEAILVTAVGSLSIRTERQFFMSGKLGRTHQLVQIFVKGDPVLACDAVSGKTADQRRAELAARAEARKKATAADWGGE